MPAHWLLKTEPSTYSFDRLVADGAAVWDGVRNNLALKYLREMKPGDRVLVYHSGAEKAVVGQARVTKAAYPDPTRDDPKLVVIDLAPGPRLARPVPLTAIRQDPDLAELPLVRMSRLSVMPVAPEHWKRLLELATTR